VSVSPILPDEVDAIVNQIDTAPADDVVGILAGLDKGFGENVALNFAAKRPELGIAVSRCFQFAAIPYLPAKSSSAPGWRRPTPT